MQPTVSIILPTYNRARFLPQAFASIQQQTCPDWELIIVDDGSTDDTRERVAQLSANIPQHVRYLYQQNQGPALARNAGIEVAHGSRVAFFDSDDLWCPHHLEDCLKVLRDHSEVAWVYGAGQRVEHNTGRVLVNHSFYPNGKPLPFLHLHTRNVGGVQIIDDDGAVVCQLRHGLYCGFQNSVVRRTLLDHIRIPPFRIAEDRAFAILALKAGYRLAYLDQVHVIYHVHEGNCSSAGPEASLEKKLKVQMELLRCYEWLQALPDLTARERREVNLCLSREYFWHLGYALYWAHGRRQDAMRMYSRGLRLNPVDWRLWKTYLLALPRVLL